MPAPASELSEADLRRKAIGLLGRREHSRRELTQKLGRGADAALVMSVIDALAEEGLQSDTRCAEMIIFARIERGHGPLRIRSDLRDVGIGSETVEHLLEAEEDHWEERLQKLVERRYRGEAPADARDWSKRARFLASRGFPEGLVRRVLGDLPR